MTARALGMSVAEVLVMTPAEYTGWRYHLSRYPPMEFILAALWLTVSRALGNDKAKPEDMGYWLETPAMRKQRQADELHTKRAAQARRTRAAYRQRRDKG